MTKIKNKVKNNSRIKKAWVRTISKESNKLSNKEIAKKISDESGINVTESDIKKYNHIPEEDYELENRKISLFFNLKRK